MTPETRGPPEDRELAEERELTAELAPDEEAANDDLGTSEEAGPCEEAGPSDDEGEQDELADAEDSELFMVKVPPRPGIPKRLRDPKDIRSKPTTYPRGGTQTPSLDASRRALLHPHKLQENLAQTLFSACGELDATRFRDYGAGIERIHPR